ncbi:hypothetical protein H6F43_13285 [Leptolyngbya sp. FACHB-36]|uniref:hypothetical protein n=1 Tax=Leptolyngbya sp. FACHB-36 TaxID=2692808 RepID=UPI001680093A|nr:hypothetical protein [Leptolyngbya sp. FACHB-36]MBD2021151.1 hypothetical protein [Leptolyngbya sp. FACHB-36]
MDPVTIATIVLTILATKATEKVGEKIGEGALAEGKKLLGLLQRKSPETVKRLEAATDPNVIDAEVVEEVRRVSVQEPEVKAAVDATAMAVQQQPGGIVNFGKMNIANTGFVQTQNNTFI